MKQWRADRKWRRRDGAWLAAKSDSNQGSWTWSQKCRMSLHFYFWEAAEGDWISVIVGKVTLPSAAPLSLYCAMKWFDAAVASFKLLQADNCKAGSKDELYSNSISMMLGRKGVQKRDKYGGECGSPVFSGVSDYGLRNRKELCPFWPLAQYWPPCSFTPKIISLPVIALAPLLFCEKWRKEEVTKETTHSHPCNDSRMDRGEVKPTL